MRTRHGLTALPAPVQSSCGTGGSGRSFSKRAAKQGDNPKLAGRPLETSSKRRRRLSPTTGESKQAQRITGNGMGIGRGNDGPHDERFCIEGRAPPHGGANERWRPASKRGRKGWPTLPGEDGDGAAGGSFVGCGQALWYRAQYPSRPRSMEMILSIGPGEGSSGFWNLGLGRVRHAVAH